jgi:hypothetical protein
MRSNITNTLKAITYVPHATINKNSHFFNQHIKYYTLT